MSEELDPPRSPDSAPISPFFRAWARVVLRFRWVFMLLTLGTTAFMVHQTATRLLTDNSIEAFLASDSQAARWLDQLRDDFGRDEMFLVLVSGDVFSPAYLDRLKQLHEELGAIDMPLDSLGKRRRVGEKRVLEPQPTRVSAAPRPPEDDFEEFGDDAGWGDEAGGTLVDEITSLVNIRETRWQDGGMVVGGLLDTWPTPEQLPALRARVLKERSMVGRVIDPEGKHSVVMLRTDFMDERDMRKVHETIEGICARHAADDFQIRLAGLPALAVSINKLMFGDLTRMALVGLLLMFAIMAALFRHPIGVVGPVLVVAMAVQWTFGTMALFGLPMTMISSILPAFITCVGIGDSIHIQSVYRDARRFGLDTHDAIVHAVATTGVPVLYTTLTTCVGLLSFRLASVDAIQDMGTFGAYGVAVALLHTLVFIPCLLSFHRRGTMGAPAAHHERDRIDRLIARCDGLSTSAASPADADRRRRRTNLAAGAVAALSIAGMSTLVVYHNPLAWIPDGFEVKDAFTLLDDHMGGTADLSLLIETKPDKNLRDRELLLALEGLEGYIRDYEHPTVDDLVGNSISVLDVVRESNRATHESDEAYYALPDTPRGVADMLTLFENAGPEQLRRLATIDLTRSVMTIRVRWLDASSYGPLSDYIHAGIARYVGDLANVKPTGAVFNLLTVVGHLLDDLLKSFAMAFVLITVFMIALLRSLKLGLIAMIPNLLPIAMILGGMGFLGVPIDLNNILIASIAIGIAVDDTIHYLHQFSAHYRESGDTEAAIRHAFNHAGRAMVTTSIILVTGFCVFGAADMHNVQRFGILVASTTVFALFSDLVFTPALLRTFYRPVGATNDITQGDDHASNVQTA